MGGNAFRKQEAGEAAGGQRGLRRGWRGRLGQAGLIGAGCLLYAAGISLFLDPNRLAPGGVSGLAIILGHISGWDTGLLILLLNIPILGLGLWKLGWRAMIPTLLTVPLATALVDMLAPFGPLSSHPLLAACYGGGLEALGLAMVFRADSTTGGADVVVLVLRQRFPHIKSGALFLWGDGAIILAAGLIFRDMELALFAGVADMLFCLLFDYFLYGGDSAKLLYIISDQHQVLARRLLQEAGVGATYLQGVGAWSGREKQVLVCAMKNRLFRQAHQIILEEDPAAFLIVGQATEIFGEGFKAHDQPPL